MDWKNYEEKLGLGLLLGSLAVLGFSNGVYFGALLLTLAFFWVMAL